MFGYTANFFTRNIVDSQSKFPSERHLSYTMVEELGLHLALNNRMQPRHKKLKENNSRLSWVFSPSYPTKAECLFYGEAQAALLPFAFLQDVAKVTFVYKSNPSYRQTSITGPLSRLCLVLLNFSLSLLNYNLLPPSKKPFFPLEIFLYEKKRLYVFRNDAKRRRQSLFISRDVH